MYKWSIDKTFSWEMGHRVHSQTLNRPDLSISTECSCKHLHGHSYKMKVFLSSNSLDGAGMVTDFKNLEFVKKFIDGNLDHKFMIDINDPNFGIITGVRLLQEDKNKVNDFSNLSSIIREQPLVVSSTLELHINSFVLVNWVPTSENICKGLLEHIEQLLNMPNIVVEAVELWETEKSHCRYTNPKILEVK